MIDVEQDKLLRDIACNIREAIGLMDQLRDGEARGVLEGTCKAIKDIREKRIKRQRETDKVLDRMDYDRWH